ncbi:MAG: MBL fold metallo-hydrolase, partial [Calditrichaeota bacterium]
PKRLTELENQYQVEKDPHQREELQMWIGYFQAMVQSFPRLKTILPNVTFTKELTIYGGKREARLISYEQGHTGSDLILYLPREKIVFTGDLVFIKMHPYLADGFPNHWIEILEDMSRMKIQKVVPGHGPVGDADDVTTMLHYIKTATEIVEKMSEQGKSIEEILAQPIPSPFTDWYFPRFYKINMRFLYGRNEQGVESN